MHRKAPSKSSLFVLAGVLIAVGVVLRIVVLSSRLGSLDSDEAVVGMMSRQLAFAHHFRIFYWGQPYGGSQEAVIAAVFFKIFGATVGVLKSSVLLMNAISAVLVWRLGRRIFDNAAAVVAGSLYWAASFPVLWMSTKERGFYGMTTVCGLVILLAAVRLVEKFDWRVALWGGFFAGFGIWASPQIAYFLVPAAIWLIVRTPKNAARSLPFVIPALLIGAIPLLYFNFHNDWVSLHPGAIVGHSNYVGRLGLFFSTGFPIILGFKVPYSTHWLVDMWLGLTLYVIAGLLAVAALVKYFRLARRAPKPWELLVLMLAIYPFIFAASPYSFYVSDPRYLTFIWVPTALLIGFGITKFRIQWLGSLAVVALTLAVMQSIFNWGPQRTHYDLVSGNIQPLIAQLNKDGVKDAYTDYWVSYRLDFETKQKITATPLTSVRDSGLQAEVNSSGNPAYVFFALSSQNTAFTSALDGLKIGYQKQYAGQYVVFLPGRYVDPATISGVW